MKERLLYFFSSLVTWWVNLRGSKELDVKRILVVKLDEIGDMVTCLHIFDHLIANYPNASIDLLAKPVNHIFFKYINYVQVIEIETLKSNSYDVIIDLRGSFETAIYALLKRPQRRFDRGSIRMYNKTHGGQRNEIITNYQIIKPIIHTSFRTYLPRIISSEDEQNKVADFISTNNVKQFAVLHIGARDKPRRWPIDRFASVIKKLNRNNIVCILAGGPDDYRLNEECMKLIGPENINVAGVFNLLEFSELCKRAMLFIGNESGPLHVAATHNIPLIGLYGPGVKDVFYPIGDKSIVLHHFLSSHHTKQTIENSTIFKISVDEVFRAIKKQTHLEF